MFNLDSEKFAYLSTSLTYSCGLTTSGKAFCWGGGTFGNLGNADTADIDRPDEVNTLTLLGGETTFIAISVPSAGLGSHACAITTNGVPYCWGSDANGQLGNGAITGQQSSPYPVNTADIAGAKTFKEISVGVGHTCGITTDSKWV